MPLVTSSSRLCRRTFALPGSPVPRPLRKRALVLLPCLALLLAASVTACAAAPGGRASATVRDRVGLGLDSPPTPAARPDLAWRRGLVPHETLAAFRPLEFSAPVPLPGEGAIVAGSSSGEVLRLASSDGAVLWRTRLGGPVHARPLYTAGVLLVGSDDGNLYRLDPGTGKVLWQHAVRSLVRSQPLVQGGRVFFTSEEETIHAVDLLTGKWLWSQKRPLPDGFTIGGVATPVFAGGRVIAAFADGAVIAYQPEDGKVVWSRQLASPGTQFADVDALLVANGRLYAASIGAGLARLEPETGELVWQQPRLQGVVTLAEVGGELLAGTGDGTLLRLGGDPAQVRWARRFGGGPIRGITARDGQLFLSGERLGLLVLDEGSGALRDRFDPGRGISGPVALLDGHLFFLSNGGYLYGLKLR